MTPVFQTKFGKGQGNCFAACLASLLDLSIEEVPNFCHEERNNTYWMRKVQKWLLKYDLGIVSLNFYKLEDMKEAIKIGNFPKNVYYIISGQSPRGLLHAVIGQNGEVVHDPHPDGGGIEVEEPCEIELLVKM